MMNIQSHIVASLVLVVMALIIHPSIRNDTNTRALDTVRYYTMKRMPGDISAARALVESEDKWLTLNCQAAQNKTSFSDACVVERKALRDSILAKMNCMSYNSQLCNYLRNLTSGLIQNKTYGGTSYAVGKALSGFVPGQSTLTYRQVLWNALNNAQYLFRNSYKATQADDFFVLRTILFNLIVYPVLGNLLVHYIDHQYQMSWTYRLVARIVVHSLFSIVPTALFLIGAGGATVTAIVGIWLPAFIILIYYEAFLDATITRPWIHPYIFSIIYTSLSILALTENGVLNSAIVTITVGMAQAVSFLYMQIVWYWAGYTEKKTHKPSAFMEGTHAADLYLTKEMQYALFLGIITITIVPLLQTVAPFDYDCSDLLIRGAPLGFLAISVFGTLYVQDMRLGDHYGKDVEKSPPGLSDKELLIFRATRVTGGKLAVSLLLLAFAGLYEFNIVGQYFRWVRAYSDKLPERAWQFDLQNKYTIGTGFLPSTTLYL